ncbi:MAG: response regulator [Hyphomonadaceae bacterium]|nr:response regulator [Hyphomonadaceae bacterium]
MTTGAKVLIVEDDALIAMEMAERVTELGFEVLGPAHSLAEADAVLAGDTPEIALLDANLGGVSTVELGVRLDGMGVRIAFCTGYDHVRGLPKHLAKTMVLMKPISDADLKAGLEALRGGR